MMSEAAQWIEKLQLQAHPEGGYYRETYRSALSLPESVLPAAFSGDRSVCTGIYYLLQAGDCSRLHRIASDEMWHFHAGGTLAVHVIDPTGDYQCLSLGLSAGAVPQQVVPAGAWFGAEPSPGTDYVLVGCTVAPGFDFADFQMADRAALLAAYPRHAGLIRRLTVEPADAG